MKEAISKVKAAIAPKDIASHLSHYLVKDGMVHASDNRMVAAAPFPLAGTFMVPGGEFEAVANRFGPKTKLKVEENTVVFTDGKLKATLRCMKDHAIDYQLPKGKPVKPPADLLTALGRVRPFISDNAVHFWALAVCLDEDFIYATNNVVVARADCKGLKGKGKLLPCWAVDYLLSRSEELVGMLPEEGSITFFWDDKSWMKAQLIDGKFPAQAAQLVGDLATPKFKLNDDWKAAFTSVSDMADGIIELHADRMVGVTTHGEIEFEMKTVAPEGGPSKWNTKFLTPVVAASDVWQPDTWPKPSPFAGKGIRGLIVGRN